MAISDEIKFFLIEGQELSDQIEKELLELENHTDSIERVQPIFRAIHTIKGNAGFLGLQCLEELCHAMETLLDRMRSAEYPVTSEAISVLLESLDDIRKILLQLESQQGDTTGLNHSGTESLQRLLSN